MVRFGPKDTTKYNAIIIKSDTQDPELVTLPDGNKIENEYYTHYYRHVRKDTNAIDTKSYKHFWKPIADKIQGYDTVYFSADGIYNLLNIYTLYDTEKKAYLIDKPQVILSVGNLKDIKTKEQRNKKLSFEDSYVALVGDPLYDGNSLPAIATSTESASQSRAFDLTSFLKNGKVQRLKYSKIEIETLENLFKNKGTKTAIFIEKTATEQAIKNLKSPAILHISTHGFFTSDTSKFVKDDLYIKKIYQENPFMRCGLLLANCESAIKSSAFRDSLLQVGLEDGILTAQEIVTLDLEGTKLVTLSACETGKGERMVGEGVYNFQRAFQEAGAERVIMSLWQVPDLQASLFMREYLYPKLLKESKINMKSAQKNVKQEFPHPFYWGGFVMIGE